MKYSRVHSDLDLSSSLWWYGAHNTSTGTEIAKVGFKGKISKMANWNIIAFCREGSYYENVSIISEWYVVQKNQLGRKKKIKLENKIRKRHLLLFKSQLKIGVQNSFFYGGEDRDTAKCLLFFSTVISWYRALPFWYIIILKVPSTSSHSLLLRQRKMLQTFGSSTLFLSG